MLFSNIVTYQNTYLLKINVNFHGRMICLINYKPHVLYLIVLINTLSNFINCTVKTRTIWFSCSFYYKHSFYTFSKIFEKIQCCCQNCKTYCFLVIFVEVKLTNFSNKIYFDTTICIVSYCLAKPITTV